METKDEAGAPSPELIASAVQRALEARRMGGGPGGHTVGIFITDATRANIAAESNLEHISDVPSASALQDARNKLGTKPGHIIIGIVAGPKDVEL